MRIVWNRFISSAIREIESPMSALLDARFGNLNGEQEAAEEAAMCCLNYAARDLESSLNSASEPLTIDSDREAFKKIELPTLLRFANFHLIYMSGALGGDEVFGDEEISDEIDEDSFGIDDEGSQAEIPTIDIPIKDLDFDKVLNYLDDMYKKLISISMLLDIYEEKSEITLYSVADRKSVV